MYVQKGKPLKFAAVKKKIIEKAKHYLEKNYVSGEAKLGMKEALSGTGEHILNSFCQQLVDLNDALLKGRSVYAVCEKAPRKLDYGRHWYSIYFVNKKGEFQIFWSRGFTALVGADIQNKDRNMRKFIFSSRVIGMSRCLDATDGLFNLLKDLGGCYAQVNVL